MSKELRVIELEVGLEIETFFLMVNPTLNSVGTLPQYSNHFWKHHFQPFHYSILKSRNLKAKYEAYYKKVYEKAPTFNLDF